MKEKNKNIVIFSHGFGTRKDDRGLLSNIAEELKQTDSILFDYNGVDEKENILTVRTLSEQAKMLADVVNKAKLENPSGVINIIAHSQGCLVVALAVLPSINKIIFITPSLDNDIEHTINMFKDRLGTEINLDGVSKLVRRDGTLTMVPSEFWVERKKIYPKPLYNKLSLKTDLIIINAKQDEVLGRNASIDDLNENIKVIAIDGDHQLNGDARALLLKIIKNFLYKDIKKIWFKRKLYGFGWYPVTWEGWLTTLVWVLLFSFSMMTMNDHEWLKNFVVIILSVIVLIYICYKKGEKPRWQWGKRIED
ncbi:MAG: GPI inositol-deacylase [Burkholderiales bacterium]|nr:GPI inositol-deacylase [Burkholderiales bacterium]